MKSAENHEKPPYAYFDAAAQTYDHAAELQRQVARNLAEMIYQFRDTAGDTRCDPIILEVGCGTGVMSRELSNLFGGEARYVLSDMAREELVVCRSHFNPAADFVITDGQEPAVAKSSVDYIASSMVVQWFDDPAASIEKWQGLLSPGGALFYSTIGPRNFHQWRDHLDQHGLPCGMRDDLPPTYPGQVYDEFIPRDYGDARGFFNMLKRTGAGRPREGHREGHQDKTDRRAFKRACDGFDGHVDWHIVYGVLPSLSHT